jgi:hypothetical protein
MALQESVKSLVEQQVAAWNQLKSGKSADCTQPGSADSKRSTAASVSNAAQLADYRYLREFGSCR